MPCPICEAAGRRKARIKVRRELESKRCVFSSDCTRRGGRDGIVGCGGRIQGLCRLNAFRRFPHEKA